MDHAAAGGGYGDMIVVKVRSYNWGLAQAACQEAGCSATNSLAVVTGQWSQSFTSYYIQNASCGVVVMISNLF